MHHDRPRQENPLVTVLMPAHNEEEFISEAIESVLAQSYENFELLVLDDASQDETQRIVDSFIDPRIRRHRNIRNLGVSRTLNLGFDLARGKYVAVLGGDDRMVTTRLSKQVSLLESDPTLIACGSWYLRFGYQNYVEETPVGREAVRDGFLLFPSVGGGGGYVQRR